jgi:hypothetical protein
MELTGGIVQVDNTLIFNKQAMKNIFRALLGVSYGIGLTLHLLR